MASDLDQDVGTPDRVEKTRRHRWILEWTVVLVAALGLAVALRTFVIQTYSIPSGSMIPTLMVGDRILVDKLSYHLHPVHRGDVVVFATPPKELSVLMVNDLVKRVIGLPGETISSGPRGEVLINGKVIDQPWLTASARADPGPPIRTQRIPAGDIFVMGDNRGLSDDSRDYGPVSESLIVGRAVFGFWPLSRIHLL
ncbi:MAG TPA: signal peptidase I [Acidimicrobiales bacterium]|nr:signal peptidase I [Acidimicrobiales bacterium]